MNPNNWNNQNNQKKKMAILNKQNSFEFRDRRWSNWIVDASKRQKRMGVECVFQARNGVLWLPEYSCRQFHFNYAQFVLSKVLWPQRSFRAVQIIVSISSMTFHFFFNIFFLFRTHFSRNFFSLHSDCHGIKQRQSVTLPKFASPFVCARVT